MRLPILYNDCACGATSNISATVVVSDGNNPENSDLNTTNNTKIVSTTVHGESCSHEINRCDPRLTVTCDETNSLVCHEKVMCTGKLENWQSDCSLSGYVLTFEVLQ